ncbi:MAG: hypothetical protein U9R72_00320 [Chloroflexota bacterium]|nr:hypothetical protein [Chloroflexota bacterium]
MNLIERYEQYLEERVEAGEIKEHTKDLNLLGAAKVLEALVAQLPQRVLEAFVRERGLTGAGYPTTIRQLKGLLREEKSAQG